jgi:hypothetical protein
MFDLEDKLEKYLLELKENKPVTEKKQTEIKSKLFRAGILDKNGKLKKIKIK